MLGAFVATVQIGAYYMTMAEYDPLVGGKYVEDSDTSKEWNRLQFATNDDDKFEYKKPG